MYGLEGQLSELEDAARSIHSGTQDTELAELEDQVATAAAQVHHAELQVSPLLTVPGWRAEALPPRSVVSRVLVGRVTARPCFFVAQLTPLLNYSFHNTPGFFLKPCAGSFLAKLPGLC